MTKMGTMREPAAPRGLAQTERRERILHAASVLASTEDFEDLQMQDVARAAGVAIGTLYRYFPSKTQLMVAVIAEELSGMVGSPRDPEKPADAVRALLLAWFDQIAVRPSLATAALHASSVAYASNTPDSAALDAVLVPAVLEAIGRRGPQTSTVVRLLMFTWWGVVVTAVSGQMKLHDARRHIEVAADLLLVGIENHARTQPGGSHVAAG